MFTELKNIANASLGYKSLQNDFFYLNQATIDSFGIESHFLLPIVRLRDFDANVYLQSVSAEAWLFNCRDKVADLRGTGALRYIESMADRSAAKKKQSGKPLTIKKALEAQGGGLWYAPKATPHQHHVWVRKAINGMYAPFVCADAVLVDQRCNSIAPADGLTWRELASVLTTSIFAYGVEVNGGASMGAGALEAPTTKLREYPVLDLRAFDSKTRSELVKLAEVVWQTERPVDWSDGSIRPGAALRALDSRVLELTGKNVGVERLYSDLSEVCRSRISVAKDKVKTTKKKKTENIGSVADSIANYVKPQLAIKNFPDDFFKNRENIISLHIDNSKLREILITPLLGSYDILLSGKDGQVIYEGTHPRSVAEAIVRAILWGRTIFSVGTDETEMEAAIQEFLNWAESVEKTIVEALRESSLGTGYEDVLRSEVYRRLGIDPLALAKTLPTQIALTIS